MDLGSEIYILHIQELTPGLLCGCPTSSLMPPTGPLRSAAQLGDAASDSLQVNSIHIVSALQQLISS